MTAKNRLRTPPSIAATAMALAFGAVVPSGGCARSTKVEAHKPTVGQELQDLDAARNKGLMTDAEYSKKRQEIMKRK